MCMHVQVSDFIGNGVEIYCSIADRGRLEVNGSKRFVHVHIYV